MKKNLIVLIIVMSISNFAMMFAACPSKQLNLLDCKVICGEVIEVWTILDVLRSVTIEPEARVFFIHKIFNDILTILCNVAALRSQCLCSIDYYYANKNDIIYLTEIIDHMKHAFIAVMLPFVCGEEELVGNIVQKITEIITQLNDVFASEQSLNFYSE